MYLNYLASIGHYIPELIACVTMIGLILIESTRSKTASGRWIFYFCAYLGLGVTAISLIGSFSDQALQIFTKSVTIDSFGALIKIILTLGTLGAVYLSSQSKDITEDLRSEFTIIAVGVLVGGMLLTSANNMLILYIGIETLSILSYVLASLNKNDERSSEAGLKYSLYGGISAGIMLFGLSHIFGVTGSIQFNEIAAALTNLDTTQLAIVLPAFLLFFAGLGYKIACVPFHMWAPDVYEGSPVPVTTFFAIVPKMAGMAVLIRVSMTFFGTEGILQTNWVGLLTIVSAMTMTIGNISALGQKSIKRMLAYSSIAHAGVMIAGIVVLNEVGVRAILFYGVTYLFMTLVAFYIVGFVNDQYGNDHFDRFNGLMYRYPLMAIIMTMVMFSLAGVPPLSGFVAKFNILSVIIDKGHYTLAIILGVNSVISVYYYLKIIRTMIFKPVESNEAIAGFGYMNRGIIIALSIPVLILGIFWSQLMHISDGAKLFIP